MKITIFGSGYVGLVTGACLADAGNHVVCVDVDVAKIASLNRGEIPIHEPVLEAIERLGLPMRDREQQFRRMVFNVVARNQDDHRIAARTRRRSAWSTLRPSSPIDPRARRNHRRRR